MLPITTAIFLTLVGSAIYHLIPATMRQCRLFYVASLSFVIVFAYYPLAALLAVLVGLFAWLLAILGQRNAVIGKYGPFSLIAILAAFSFQNVKVPTSPYGDTLVQFGLSFYVLRLYLAIRTAAARREKVSLAELLTIALFFPIFPAGPICAQSAFTGSPHSNSPLVSNYLLGLLRIGIGIFALYLVTDVIKDAMNSTLQSSGYSILWHEMGRVNTYLYMVLSFLNLYANFVGYTEIAIGLGLFFGFSIPENFKYPFLATNIQNFWQRWHLTLSKFITTQIYLPIMISLRRQRLSIFLAFSLVGMWHQVNLQYAAWGVGHGALLAAYMTFSGSALHASIISRIPPRLWAGFSWWLTMSLVAFLSTFANLPDLDTAVAFARTLVTG